MIQLCTSIMTCSNQRASLVPKTVIFNIMRALHTQHGTVSLYSCSTHILEFVENSITTTHELTETAHDCRTHHPQDVVIE